MSEEVKESPDQEEQNVRVPCDCSCSCRGCICRRADSAQRYPFRWQNKSARERIRVSESICWRDRAINDFTGNLSGVIGFKKILHPVPAHTSKRKAYTHKNSANKKKTVPKSKPTQPITEAKSEFLKAPSIENVIQDDKAQECKENVKWRTLGDSEVLVHFKTDASKSENKIRQRSDQPRITEILEDLPERPTAELDISSEDDSFVCVPVKESISDGSSTRQQYTRRLFANENQRLTEKRKTSRRKEEKVPELIQKEFSGNLWSTRAKTLLGYDFVAGSVDNLPFLSSAESYQRLKAFREANRDDCVRDVAGNEENTNLGNFSDHHCLHAYRINERLFAETEDRREESICGICSLLRGQSANQPVHLSISVPTLETSHKPKRAVSSAGKARITSLALMQNCDFKLKEASRRCR